MYPCRKKLQEERNPSHQIKPTLLPVTDGSVLTRFGCIVMVKMNRVMVADQLLSSRKCSFMINGDVHQVILACTITLEINPSWIMLDLDSDNAHTLCSRDKLEVELEINLVYHYMLMSYKDIYRKTLTFQSHFGN